MESIKELFKIGVGPSSSHTVGPMKVCLRMNETYPNATHYEVTLYGSLALTGKGHLTDYIIQKTLNRPVTIHWMAKALDYHPNGMKVEVYQDEACLDTIYAYSIGGGSVVYEGEDFTSPKTYYLQHNFNEIKQYVSEHHICLYDYMMQVEDDDFKDYMEQILDTMCASVEAGLKAEGVLPGKLQLKRVAKELYKQATDERMKITSYAYAVSEQNASGNVIVTAPTCGASGVIPAIVYCLLKDLHYEREVVLKALCVSGLIGNIIKTNATISGAEGGCQAEVGSAIAMGAALYATVLGLDLEGIEYASEMGLEHQLGLTCDPVGGYVQIPCIERNGFGALRAIDAAIHAKQLGQLRKNKVSFDAVVKVMKDTGKDLKEAYRETSLGGLAKELPIHYD